jgi:Holliday junction DNA helicase RuvB
MVAWEQGRVWTGEYDGWQWHDVHVNPRLLNQMVAAGILNVVSESRKYTHYRLVSLVATQEALAMVQVAPEPTVEERSRPVDVDSLFEDVVGHESAKMLIRYALTAHEPVHCLLIGPVGTAKTMMLEEIGRLGGSEYYLGSTTTKAGLVGLLIGSRPRYLMIDELDKMSREDMWPLLTLMEGGQVMRLQHKLQERVRLTCSVFAGANTTKHLPDTVLSRFVQIQVPGYSEAEFVEVGRQVLMRRVGLGEQEAYHIASEVARVSLDIRDAIKVGRLTKGYPLRVYEVIRALWPQTTLRRPIVPLNGPVKQSHVRV